MKSCILNSSTEEAEAVDHWGSPASLLDELQASESPCLKNPTKPKAQGGSLSFTLTHMCTHVHMLMHTQGSVIGERHRWRPVCLGSGVQTEHSKKQFGVNSVIAVKFKSFGLNTF